MTRKDIITNSGYWEEYANAWKYNKSTDAEIAKDIIRVVNEALNMADVGESCDGGCENDDVKPHGSKFKCNRCGTIHDF